MTLSRAEHTAAATGGRGDRLSREVLVLSAVVILGTIMTVLDLTIVNVAVPTLGGDLHASIPAIQWVLTGYMLAFAAVIPLTGWAAERFGAKRVWLAALGLFLAGSVLAGAAWSVGSLIAFRVLQGLGAGMILPVGQAILAQAAGPQRMGRVMSVIGVPMLLAPVFGPVLGGAIIGAASWRWIFFINLPIGAAAVVAAWRLLPDARPRLGQRLDLRGLALLCPGIAVFLYGMSEAGDYGGFGSPRTSVAALAGLTLIALFFWHAVIRGMDALIDVSLLRRRGFAAAAALNFLLPVALFGSLILIPLYYQVVRHNSPVQIGLLLGPQGIGAALALSLAGSLTDKIGARVVATVGMVVALLGTLAYTAIAHTLLKIAYQVLKSGTPYQDLGADFYTRRGLADQDHEHSRSHRMGAQILLRDQVLALPRRAAGHRDGVIGGPGPDPPREPPRQPHQVSVVQHRIRLGVTTPDQAPPPGPEPARRVAHRVVGIQHDPVHAVIRAGQQARIARREVIGHPPTVGPRRPSRQPDCPKGPFLPGEVPDGT
jgi:EmrB/QacA subfamily drug resistance transporter